MVASLSAGDTLNGSLQIRIPLLSSGPFPQLAEFAKFPCSHVLQIARRQLPRFAGTEISQFTAPSGVRPLGAKGDDREVQEIGVNSAVGLVFVVPVRHRLFRLFWMTADWRRIETNVECRMSDVGCRM